MAATAATQEANPSAPSPVVAMFVYNNCAADQRVLKEAATLIRAGYAVTIYAVLDKETTPLEVLDGIRIVRINRQPLHIRARARYRRVRANVRLRAVSRGTRRVVRMVRKRRPLGRLFESRLYTSGAAAYSRLVVQAIPGRGYRYLRWRLLLYVPPLRRRFYRRRATLHARAPHPERAARLDAYLQRNIPAMGSAARADGAPPTAVPPAARGTSVGRLVARWTWKRVMVLHKPLNFVDYYRRAYSAALAEGFDAIHAHDLLTLPVGAALARRTGRPLVYDAHELYTEMSTLRRSERTVWRYMERRDIGRSTRIITVCESIAGELVSRYGVDRPLVLLNCPPAPKPSSAHVNRLRERVGVTDASMRIVLYQGGLVPNRGLEELIEAAASFDDAVLVLMGSGRLQPVLERQIGINGLDERVIIAEPVRQSELLSFTRGADVGVIPYKAVGLNNFYTTPNKLFEYLAAGIPIACSRFPELRRFVEHTGAGLTFDPSDPDDIALAINGILADDLVRQQMREAAVVAAAPLTWERESRKLVELYAGLEISPPLASPKISAGVS